MINTLRPGPAGPRPRPPCRAEIYYIFRAGERNGLGRIGELRPAGGVTGTASSAAYSPLQNPPPQMAAAHFLERYTILWRRRMLPPPHSFWLPGLHRPGHRRGHTPGPGPRPSDWARARRPAYGIPGRTYGMAPRAQLWVGGWIRRGAIRLWASDLGQQTTNRGHPSQ